MFTQKSRFQRDQTVLQVGILLNEKALTYLEVIQLWKENAEFRIFFSKIIADAPYPAVYWETPPISLKNSHQPFEMVLLESRSLVKVAPEPAAFQKHFKQSENTVVVFPNLGKNALLVVPKPMDDDNYPHLSAFIRQAPEVQIHEFWQTLATTIEGRLSEKPVWISTAGNGVYWVHVRLDNRPKYYKYLIYKEYQAVF